MCMNFCVTNQWYRHVGNDLRQRSGGGTYKQTIAYSGIIRFGKCRSVVESWRYGVGALLGNAFTLHNSIAVFLKCRK